MDINQQDLLKYQKEQFEAMDAILRLKPRITIVIPVLQTLMRDTYMEMRDMIIKKDTDSRDFHSKIISICAIRDFCLETLNSPVVKFIEKTLGQENLDKMKAEVQKIAAVYEKNQSRE